MISEEQKEMLTRIKAWKTAWGTSDNPEHRDDWANNFLRDEEIFGKVINLILSAPKVISRERVRYWIPCTCDEAYTGRGLSAPDCPFHAFTGWEDLLNELGYTVEPEEEK